MAFIPAPNCCSLALVFSQEGQIVENILNFRNETPFDSVSLALLCVKVRDWWADNLKALVPATVSLDKIIARALDTDHSPAVEVTEAMPIVGIHASQAVPNSVTVAIKWQTGLSGRSYRGRTYHVGLQESYVAANEITAAGAALLLAAYGDLLTDMDGTPYNLVVLSRYSNNQPRTTAVATEVDGISIDTFVDSQRRRLPGRGR